VEGVLSDVEWGGLPDGRGRADQQIERFSGGRTLTDFVKLGVLGSGIRPMRSAARPSAQMAERFHFRIQRKFTTQGRANPFAQPSSFPGY